jgi:hypothetical protein
MARTYGTYVKESDKLQGLVGKPEGWNRLRGLIVDSRIILKTDRKERG